MIAVQASLHNSLLGGAVGDAYGLPFEGLCPKRIAKRFDADNAYHLILIIKGVLRLIVRGTFGVGADLSL